MMWNAITSTADWFLGLLEGFDPGLWTFLGIAAAALLVLLLIIRSVKAASKLNRPELIVTLGKIVIGDANAKNAYGEAEPVFSFGMTVNNLNAYPVQLLEVSLKSGDMKLPVVAEIGELVPPNSSLKVRDRLTGLWGDGGRLELYFYAASNVKRYFKLQGDFLWEPWHGYYKINPSGQSISRTKRLASDSLRRARERQWRQEEAERKREQARAERQERQTRAARDARGERERTRKQERVKPSREGKDGDAPEEPNESRPARPKLDFPDKF